MAAPLDTVKTRIQNANFERKVHGVTVIKELIKNEGPTAFFKGLTPKVRSLFPFFPSWHHPNDSSFFVDPCRWPQACVQLHIGTVSYSPFRSLRVNEGVMEPFCPPP